MQNTLTPASGKKTPEQLPEEVMQQVRKACSDTPIGVERANCVSDVTYLYQRQAARLKAKETPREQR